MSLFVNMFTNTFDKKTCEYVRKHVCDFVRKHVCEKTREYSNLNMFVKARARLVQYGLV